MGNDRKTGSRGNKGAGGDKRVDHKAFKLFLVLDLCSEIDGNPLKSFDKG